jgi:hypothetical protein
VIAGKQRATSPGRKIKVHSIEYDGAGPALWKVTTDDGVEWHAASEIEAAVELAEFITQRAQLMEALPALPEGAS